MTRPERVKTSSVKKGKPPRRGDKEYRHWRKPSSIKDRWWGEEAKKWYILFGLSVIISILLFPNILTQPKSYSLGDVADRDIKAPREFLVENNELTENNRQEAVKAVNPVYDFDPTATDVSLRVKKAFKEGRDYAARSFYVAPEMKNASGPDQKNQDEIPMDLDAFRSHFFDILEIPIDRNVFDVLMENGFPKRAEDATVNLVKDVLREGVVSDKALLMSHSGKGIVLHNIQTEKETEVVDLDRFYNLDEAKAFVRLEAAKLKKSVSPETMTYAVASLAGELIKPNLTFNKRETELRKDLARKSVKPFYFKVKKGEMLVREGERITPEHLLKLSAQEKFVKREEMINRAPAMAVLIGFLLSSVYLVGLMSGRSSRGKVRDLLFAAVTLLTFFLVVMASNFVSEEISRGFTYLTPRTLLFAMPVATGAMLISVFRGVGVAATFSLISSVLAALVIGGQVDFFIYFFISSLVAAHGVRNCRDRGVFIKTGIKVGMVNVVLALSLEALYGPFYSFDSVTALLAAFIGGILVGVIATGILPLVEMGFGYTTDIKLLELSSLDQPLLRELMVQAPGTYHHSVIVSNMVEATAEAIHANPLLAKVAAYYHDIGKMRKPLYFVENQMDGVNKHEKLAPSMSSLILISHVKDGAELAKESKLGSEITDIIRQHHGTSLISFFYERAKTKRVIKGGKSSNVNEEDFRYPGPKPQTKEAGLIMLADMVEAATKSLNDPTAARIKGTVQKIINKVFSDGQLDDCELTLKDLHKIANSFNKTLSGIFHHRVEYPEQTDKAAVTSQREALVGGRGNGTAKNKMGENGNTNHFGEGSPEPTRKEDKAEAESGLRRLGTSR